MKLTHHTLILLGIMLVSFSVVQIDKTKKSFAISRNPGIIFAMPNTINDFSANLINKTETNLNLQWKLIQNTLVKGWDYSICNYGQCIVGIPSSGKMKSIKKNEKGFLNLHVNPFRINGTGKVVFYIYEKDKENSGDTLTYIVSLITGDK